MKMKMKTTMKTKNAMIRTFRVGLVLVAMPWAATALSEAAETVTLTLKSGRTLTAHVDARSDEARLWLRFDAPSTALYRPIAWDRVVRATIAGRELSSEDMRRSIDTWKSTRPSPITPPEKSAASPAKTSDVIAHDQDDSHAQRAAQALSSRPSVVAIEVDAAVANWDADVEVDGIVLRLTARDAHGNQVQVAGVVDAKLHAERFVRAGDVPGRNGRTVQLLGHWRRSIQAGRAGRDSIVLRLPFEAVHPEFQLDVAAFGLLQVQLTAPGQGVFHATVRDVRIRPFSMVRDEIQHATQRRFLPGERTGL